MRRDRANRAGPPATDTERVAQLEQRVTELEAAVAALARFALRGGAAADVYLLPGNRVIDSRADAAVILKTARRPAGG
jgi:hypothetical protein